jgi:hypothetical protein
MFCINPTPSVLASTLRWSCRGFPATFIFTESQRPIPQDNFAARQSGPGRTLVGYAAATPKLPNDTKRPPPRPQNPPDPSSPGAQDQQFHRQRGVLRGESRRRQRCRKGGRSRAVHQPAKRGAHWISKSSTAWASATHWHLQPARRIEGVSVQ